MRNKKYRLSIDIVETNLKDLSDFYYFDEPQELEESLKLFELHYQYRSNLFKRPEIFNSKIYKWISPQTTFPTGRWVEIKKEDLYKSDEELY